MICYEDIFPSFARRLVKRDPNILINITNDAWFGRTSEPYEHLALAVYRSVETRLDLVRAVNTGVSAFIDATGTRLRQVAVGRSRRDARRQAGRPRRRRRGACSRSEIYATLGEWFGAALLCWAPSCSGCWRARAADSRCAGASSSAARRRGG